MFNWEWFFHYSLQKLYNLRVTEINIIELKKIEWLGSEKTNRSIITIQLVQYLNPNCIFIRCLIRFFNSKVLIIFSFELSFKNQLYF